MLWLVQGARMLWGWDEGEKIQDNYGLSILLSNDYAKFPIIYPQATTPYNRETLKPIKIFPEKDVIWKIHWYR